MRHRARIWILPVAMLVFGPVLGASELVRDAEMLRAMSTEEAAAGRPVEMEAIATFVDRSRGMLFAHDGRAGFYVKAFNLVANAEWLRVGRRIRLGGATGEGRFFPVVVTSELTDLGAGEMPKPAPLAPVELAAVDFMAHSE